MAWASSSITEYFPGMCKALGLMPKTSGGGGVKQKTKGTTSKHFLTRESRKCFVYLLEITHFLESILNTKGECYKNEACLT